MNIKRTTLAIAVTGLVIGMQPVFAQDVASVNGTAIPDSQFNQVQKWTGKFEQDDKWRDLLI